MRTLLNSDDEDFGGQGRGDHDPLKTKPIPCHDFDQSLQVDLPPLSGVILRCSRKNPVRKKKLMRPQRASAPLPRRNWQNTDDRPERACPPFLHKMCER